MIPTDRARRLVEALHDVSSNEQAWKIVEDAFRSEEKTDGKATDVKLGDIPPGDIVLVPRESPRRDQIAGLVWANLLTHQFDRISHLSENDHEGAALVVADLARASATYADCLIEALDRRDA